MVTDNSLLAPRRFEVRYFSLLAVGWQSCFRDIMSLWSVQRRHMHFFFEQNQIECLSNSYFTTTGEILTIFPKKTFTL